MEALARKTVTVVFADIVGSTPLGEHLDPEALRGVIDRWSDEMRVAIEHHGGTVEKFIGDAVAAVFGIPLVREDDALRAVRAAVEMRHALNALNDEIAPVRVEMRIGVNTGEVMTGEPKTGSLYASGDAVNVAARLEQTAAPGEIVIGARTYTLVRDAVVAEPLGALALKGKSAGVEAWRVIEVVPGAPGFSRRFDVALVARTGELDLLLRSFASIGDAARTVTVVGEPGIGKTRLVNELVARVGERARVVVGRCVAYGDGATFLPLAEILGQLDLAALLDGDPDADVVRRSIAGVEGGGNAISTTTHETFWAVRRLLELAAQRQPVVAVVEDVHWATPTLLDLLDYLAAFTVAPVLLVATTRAELLERHSGWEPIVRLGPLADRDALTMLDELAELPDAARRQAAEAAGGNPLFLEQLSAAFVRGEVASTPATLESVLAARIEQLDDHERATLACAAVVGREFWRGAVADLTTEERRPRTAGSLMSLIRKEFVLPDRSRFAREDAFRFRHVLIQQAAYNSVAKRTRADLHERHGEWLVSVGAEEELVGFHLEQAVLCRRALGLEADGLAERAAGVLSAAGERARKRSDLADAAALARRAATLAPELSPVRPQVLIRLARALWWDQPDKVPAVAEEAARLAARHGLEADAAEAGIWRASGDLILQRPKAVETLASAIAEARPILEATRDDARIAFLLDRQATLEQDQARPGDAVDSLHAALAAAERARDPFLLGEIVASIGGAMVSGPTPTDEMLLWGHDLLARNAGQIMLRVAVLGETVHVAYQLRGAYEDAWAAIREALEIAERIGLGQGRAVGWGHMARIALDEGDAEAALANAREGHRLATDVGLPPIGSLFYAAEALIALGRAEEAVAAIAEAVSAGSEDWWMTAEIQRLQGQVALLRGDADGAVTLIEHSLAPFRGTQCVWPQIYHGLDLARALSAAGRLADAAAVANDTLALAEAKGALVCAGRARRIAQAAAPA
jgi:class 3 adenylate cyclase/tetratricopeptide (TPR) repeat protein